VQTGQLMPAQVLRVSSEFSRLRLLRATCRQVTTVVTGAAAPVRIAAVAAPKKLTAPQKKKDDDARKKKEEDEAAAQAVMEEWAENGGCSQAAEFTDLERSAIQIRCEPAFPASCRRATCKTDFRMSSQIGSRFGG
jgi:hypothetical protein